MSVKTIQTSLLRLYRSTSVRLILLSFVIYNANLRSITSFDTNPTRYLPISILREFDFDLDEFPFLHKYPEWWLSNHKYKPLYSEQDIPYYLQYTRGHYLSTYPVMPAILSVPIYAIPVFLGWTDGSISVQSWNQTEIVGTLLSKISASLAVAISVGVLYLTLLHLTTERSALWISLIYAFATSSWAVSSQGLWQSAMSQPLLTLALYFFIKAKKNPRYIIYAGISLALSVACRPPNIIFAGIFFAYVIFHHRRQVPYFIIFPTITGTLLLAYNLYYFGTQTGGYSSVVAKGGFAYSQWESLLGLLISPSRGLLIYSPVLIFAFLGLTSVWYKHRDPLLTYTALATILTILFYSTWSGWIGGFSFSYRLLVDLLPGLSLFLAVVWNGIFTYRWSKVLFLGLVLFSVFAQIVGTFFYPCGWYESPRSDAPGYDQFWDWGDMELMRCLRAGPVRPEGLEFLLRIIHQSG